MKPGGSVTPLAATEEILGLIETLHHTERRLATLTHGQVDTVAALDGRTMLLHRSQEYLRESDAARQAAILNALPAHIALLDARGIIVSANDTWRLFVCADPFARSPGHALGVNYLDVCDGVRGDGRLDARRTADGIRSVLNDGADSFFMECQCDTPTERRSFLLTVTPLREARSTGAVVMYTDVTAQRMVEQALRDSESRFREMAENVDEVFFLRAPDERRALYISPSYERIWGRTCESFYENPDSWMDALHPADRSAIVAKNRAGLLAGHFKYEYRIIRPEGSVRWIASRGFPVRDETGTIVRIAGIAEDITERVQGLDKLRESEERYRSLTEASFDAINVTQRGIILEVNAGFEKMFGYQADEVIGRPAADFFRPESADVEHRHTFESTDARYDAIGTRKDGTKILLEVTAKNHVVGGLSARLAALRDVTEQRQFEEQLRQAQKLEAVGRLAAGVAHDFNNQLAVISAYASFVHDDLDTRDPKRCDIEEIQKAAAGAASLTRQLLTFSRQQVTAPRIIALDSVVDGLKTMLQRLIGEDIDLVTKHGDDSPTTLIDPGLAEQIIMNLVINARDAMPAGGTLTIETRVLDTDDVHATAQWTATSDRLVMLSVTDTGIGMDPEIRARVFEPFFTTKGPGTGLGLATVYGIIKQAGGSISVSSEPGEGACFKILLPFSDAPSTPLAAANDKSPTGTETILLVEDSTPVRTAVRQTLVRLGYRVLEARTGAAALAIARNEDIDLLLTDVVMPHMSGRALAESFRERRPNARILYMSGYTDDAIVRHGVLSSAVDYIEKPFTPATLARKLRHVLDRQA